VAKRAVEHDRRNEHVHMRGNLERLGCEHGVGGAQYVGNAGESCFEPLRMMRALSLAWVSEPAAMSWRARAASSRALAATTSTCAARSTLAFCARARSTACAAAFARAASAPPSDKDSAARTPTNHAAARSDQVDPFHS
jgi:hypothetical protein